MKALYLEDSDIRIKDVKIPVSTKHAALVKVLKAGICNTDIELIKGYMNFSGILGHEFVGQVVESPEPSWIGKRVVGEINLSCGTCDFCQKGESRHCSSRDVLGITVYGKVDVDLSKIVVSELVLIGSRCGPFDKVLGLLEKKSVDVEHLVDREFPLEQGIQALTFAANPDVVKVLLAP